MLNVPPKIFLIAVVFCVFLSQFTQFAHAALKIVCVGYSANSFTVYAFHNGVMKHSYDTEPYDHSEKQCAKVNLQHWTDLGGYEHIIFELANGEMIGSLTVGELRQSDVFLNLMKKKKIYFKKRRGNNNIYVLHGEQVLHSQLVNYHRHDSWTYLDFCPTFWGELSGNDVINFQISGGTVQGSVTVQLLRETGPNASVIDFSQGFRQYYRDSNGTLCFYDANNSLNFYDANGALYLVDVNGDYHFIPEP
ncbi:hypothetical protein niasHT_029665 [Heterodera trifolii]|uniref:Uncharacterized protein n=1 Tax=Heterodera trifolii TaxID=157864 RepID=A0ABD2JL05_9BILA